VSKPKLPRDVVRPKRPRRPTQTVEPDPDYMADLETTDGQRFKRMKAADRGRPVARPKPR
jgi:hypothetical protein